MSNSNDSNDSGKKKSPYIAIRLTDEERALIDACASRVIDERGRPTPTATWCRRVIMAAVRQSS